MEEKLRAAIEALNETGFLEEPISLEEEDLDDLKASFLTAIEGLSEDLEFPDEVVDTYDALMEEKEKEEKMKEKKSKKEAPAKKEVPAKKEAPTKKEAPVKAEKNGKKEKEAPVKAKSSKEAPAPAKAEKKEAAVKTEKKAKGANLPKREVLETSDGRQMWAKGSACQSIMDAVIAAGSKGITAAELEKVDFDSSNKKGKVAIMVRGMLQKELAKKVGDKLVFIAPSKK